MCSQLNDDCWLIILKYLDLREQLVLAQVSACLETTVHYYWHRVEKVQLNSDLVNQFKEQPQPLLNFLELACPSLQELTLKSGTMQLLKVWQAHGYTFPKVQTLDCDMEFNSDTADEEMLVLAQLFPRLKKLTLNSATTGCHLWLWNELQELDLTWCECLDSELFSRIFSSLPLRKLTVLYYGYNVNFGYDVLPVSQCATLEELVIDDHHMLGDFLPNLLRLPNFRKISFYTRDYHEYLLGSLASSDGHRVQALLFNDSFWSSSRLATAIESMQYLRRFALQEDDIEPKQLYKICAKLPHLEKVHLMKMRHLPTATQIWDAVAACGSLKMLDLSNSTLHEDFVESSKLCLDRVFSNRSELLTLNCYNTNLCSDQIEAVLKHPNLKITFEPTHLNVWSSRFVDIEFSYRTED